MPDALLYTSMGQACLTCLRKLELSLQGISRLPLDCR